MTEIIMFDYYYSQNSSWALDEDESDRLRQRFPNANGHLFEVVLHMGQTGLKLGECMCVCVCVCQCCHGCTQG